MSAEFAVHTRASFTPAFLAASMAASSLSGASLAVDTASRSSASSALVSCVGGSSSHRYAAAKTAATVRTKATAQTKDMHAFTA